MKNTFLITVILMLFSCREQEQRGFARITQRKTEPGNKLVLTYKYTVGIKTFYNTLTLPNRIIQQDSLPVVFETKNPIEHHLILP